MTDVDIGKIKGNVATMVQKGAPEADIDRYISESGTTLDAVRGFQAQPEGFWSHMKRDTLAGNMLTGAQESGVEMMQLGNFVGRNLYGPSPNDDKERAVYNAAQEKLEKQEGPGAANFVARMAGDPLNYPLAEIGGKKAIEGAGAAGKYIKEGTKVRMEGWNARTSEMLDKVDAQYSAMAGKHFKEMRSSGITAKPAVVEPLVQGVEKDVLEGGKLYPSRHGETIKTLEAMKEKAKVGMDVEDLDGFRRDFGQIAYKARLTGNKEDAERAREAIASIDKHFEELKLSKDVPPEMKKTIESLQKAQGIWSSRRKFETLAGAVKRSEGDPNKMAAEFDKILNTPKLHRGFTDEQMKAVGAVAKNTTAESLQKMAGKFGIQVGTGRAAATGNVIPALELMGSMAYHPAGPYGAAGIVLGTGAKQLHKLGKAGKAERAMKAVESEIPADAALGATTDPLARRP